MRKATGADRIKSKSVSDTASDVAGTVESAAGWTSTALDFTAAAKTPQASTLLKTAENAGKYADDMAGSAGKWLKGVGYLSWGNSVRTNGSKVLEHGWSAESVVPMSDLVADTVGTFDVWLESS